MKTTSHVLENASYDNRGLTPNELVKIHMQNRMHVVTENEMQHMDVENDDDKSMVGIPDSFFNKLNKMTTMLFRLYLRKLKVFLKLEKKNKRAIGGVFRMDGRELPNISGGYDLVQNNSGLGDNRFINN